MEQTPGTSKDNSTGSSGDNSTGSSGDNSPRISKGSSIYKIPEGKMIKVSLTMKDNTIEEIRITGDFFAHPEDSIEKMENMLMGTQFSNIANDINHFIEDNGIQLVGINGDGIVHAIGSAVKNSI